MRISRAIIKNYRNLRDVDVFLDSIVTLIGENNCGKSNFLRALAIPLASDDSSVSKRLSWYDINSEAKKEYYNFIKENKAAILADGVTVNQFLPHIPAVSIFLYLMPGEKEHYDVKDILCEDENNEWLGGIHYHFFIKKPEELLSRVKAILAVESDDDNMRLSLLPTELYTYSLTVPGKGCNIAYETLSMFRAVTLPAERDSFATNADKLGSRALSDLLQKGLTPASQVKIEKKYIDFFETVREEGKLDAVLNWQDYSDIPNAQEFFSEISILPNMPQMSSILGSIRLGYDNDSMFLQGLGHRNLVLMSVILNSYISKEHDISFRLMTVEEPEAHLCNSNILLMISLFNLFSQKNTFTQIVFSTHNAEFVNKLGLEKVIVFHKGTAFNLSKELSEEERDYLAANPNTDIFKLLYSKKTILVEGITEELLIKSYLQTRRDLNDIKVLSFHKGYTKIIDIWKKINIGTSNRLGVVRDFDNQAKAQEAHEIKQNSQIVVCTTKGYTLETDIVKANFGLLKKTYGAEYGWSDMTEAQLVEDWKGKKSHVMLRICHDMIAGELNGFALPPHIQRVIEFLQGDINES